MHRNIKGTAKHVSSCLQLAILLEISAQKPGNVNRTTDFPSTRYEHFLASAVAIEPSFVQAAERGILFSKGKIKLNEIGIGEIIRKAVADIKAWQRGGNTLLGTILLLSPIAVAAGIVMTKKEELSIPQLRRNIKLIAETTTPNDAVAVYEAIILANPNGLVDKAPNLDVNDPKSKEKILKEAISLYDIFRISAPYDSISREWVENYPITFGIGLPYFTRQIKEKNDFNTAVVHTFLKILATVPDTLIARKANLEKAKEISKKAWEALNLGGLTTSVGRKKLSELDEELRMQSNKLNPGTTADIIAAVLAVSILNGYRL